MNPGEEPFPIKPLPNGNMLLTVEGGSIGDGVREIDLAGNTAYQITRPDINKAVAAADIPFQLETLHHDVEKLANGHYMILGNYTQTISGQSEVGGALVDWDPSAQKAAWTWSAFDHLSLNHAPYGIADWTHANAVVYSPDDGNLVVFDPKLELRH
jgi:arylsulfate sulfotransferase